MTSDLCIAFPCGGVFSRFMPFRIAFFQIYFYAQDSFLNFSMPFHFLCVHEEIILVVFLRHDIIAGDVDALDYKASVNLNNKEHIYLESIEENL